MKKMRGKVTSKNARSPGSEWRLTCPSKVDGRESINLKSEANPGFEFDEIVVDDWLHVERMNDVEWWVRLGGMDFTVSVSKNRKVPSVARRL